MVTLLKQSLTLAEFFALSNDHYTCELIDGERVPKMSPKR